MQFLRSILACCMLLPGVVNAQESGVWSLQQCIQYAVDHNISIKQDSLTARLARYTVLQSKLSQIPTASASSSYGRSFGRSVNPTTNQYVEGDYNSLTASGTVNALLFSGLQVRNNIEKNKFALQAAIADLDQLRDDISVNVANSFLAVLLAKEQVNISKNQVLVSQAQLDQTRAFADAGRLPELNVAQLESQVASDSSNLISAQSTYNSAVLDLKALLNLDFEVPFSVSLPDIEPTSDLLSVAIRQPDEIYRIAHDHFGSIKSSQLKVNSAQRGLAAARGGLYPQLYFGYQVGTNYASNYQTYTPTPTSIYQVSNFRDSATHTSATYLSQQTSYIASVQPFADQFNNNLRHYLYLSLNVPIFNGWQTQYSIRQARINLNSSELNEYNAELTLKQNVYKAHNNAVSAVQKYNAAKRADEAAARALDFAKKRYELGLTSTVDLLVTENSHFSAASNLAIAKYDLIFKLKVIDYYLGKELKL